MGTKVMVRASRSFNGYVEGDWYMVDPSDPHEGALISGGYLEHQEHLFEGLDVETVAAVEDDGYVPYPVSPEMRAALDERYGGEVGDGEVAAEPGEHQEDGAGEGPGGGDPDSGTRAGRRPKDRAE